VPKGHSTDTQSLPKTENLPETQSPPDTQSLPKTQNLPETQSPPDTQSLPETQSLAETAVPDKQEPPKKQKQSILKGPGTSRIHLTIAYVGTAYYGWQCQARKALPLLPTIQSILEKAAAKVAHERLYIHASGRTDSGVHANAQIAHMDVPTALAHVDWQMALNHLLPPDIRIVQAKRVQKTFHAQLSCQQKTYMYRLWLSRRYTPPFVAPYVWSCGPLNIDAMEQAAACLMGTHDFSACRNMGTPRDSYVRTLYSITRHPPSSLLEHKAFDAYSAQNPDALTWYFTANGFLKQMVRNIMGLLIAVGRGKIAPERIPEILASGDRQQAPSTAPARGLTLCHVDYGPTDYTEIIENSHE